MSISKRLLRDKENRVFVPMNVEGSIGEANFITVPKIVVLSLTLVFLIYVTHSFAKAVSFKTFITLLICYYVASLVIRYAVLEEKKYYKMYKEYLKNRISGPYTGWGIASIDNSDRGAVLIYEDAKTGVVVRLDRDVIVGRKADFKEVHYDAVSNFIKSMCINKLSYVYMDMMEKASKDSRLNELDKLCNVEDNKNLKTLEELLVGHIKRITANSMSESEYYLIYTNDIVTSNRLLDIVDECVSELLNGGYASYEILGSDGLKDLNELAKDTTGSDYFNISEAMLGAYSDKFTYSECLSIVGIGWTDGKFQKIDDGDRRLLENYTSGKKNGAVASNVETIRETLSKYKEKSEKDKANISTDIVDIFEKEISIENEVEEADNADDEFIDF